MYMNIKMKITVTMRKRTRKKAAAQKDKTGFALFMNHTPAKDKQTINIVSISQPTESAKLLLNIRPLATFSAPECYLKDPHRSTAASHPTPVHRQPRRHQPWLSIAGP